MNIKGRDQSSVSQPLALWDCPIRHTPKNLASVGEVPAGNAIMETTEPSAGPTLTSVFSINAPGRQPLILRP